MSQTTTSGGGAVRVCSKCGREYPDGTKFCTEDGTPLAPKKAEPSDPMVGQILMGRWEVIELIGAGGFALVYKVRSVTTNNVEALKVFRRQRVDPKDLDEAVARFEREASILQALGSLSPHILSVSRMVVDDAEGTLYLPMELLVGQSLSTIVKREGILPARRIIPVVKQICRALEAAHGHGEGVVHRDLTLDNVMIVKASDGGELVKILDFGIAKEIGNEGLTNLTMGGPGTPAYAAPEQVEGRKVDQRTDLFTLGVCIYGMLTGHEPWLGGSITEGIEGGWKMLRQTVDGEPIAVTKWNPDADPGLVRVMLKLLEKRPEDRFQTAGELWQALDAVERGEAPKIARRETDRFRVVHAQKGVGFRIRKGFLFLAKTVAEGKTPWESETIPPGSYKVEVTDPRYEKDVREVVFNKGEDLDVKLTTRLR